MKPGDTDRSSYLKAQRYPCGWAASEVLRAQLSAPHSGVPLSVLKNTALGRQAVVNSRCTLHFADRPGPPRGLEAALTGGGGLLAPSPCGCLCSCCRLPLECVKQAVGGCSGNCSVLAWGETAAHFLCRSLKPWPGRNVPRSPCSWNTDPPRWGVWRNRADTSSPDWAETASFRTGTMNPIKEHVQLPNDSLTCECPCTSQLLPSPWLTGNVRALRLQTALILDTPEAWEWGCIPPTPCYPTKYTV